MIEDAKKTASVIGYNYPDSKWYRYSYELVASNNDSLYRVCANELR